MNADDRARLQRILASFDETGLVALTNKGLVRRAQKDLQTGGLSHEETPSAVLVRGPGWLVTMPLEGPAHATDDTRASGVTRQILMATLYLQKHWAVEVPDEQPSEAVCPPDEAAALQELLLGLSLDDLQKWAGKIVLRDVLALVKAGIESEIETRAGVTIRLPHHEVEARLLPGAHGKSPRALLDAILTTAPRIHHKRWVVAAVLAFQQSRGRSLELAAPQSAPAESGAVRSPQQVIAAVRELTEGMVSTGLAHPSARMIERLFTLSVSAIAVHLPRLARLLRSLADDVSLVLTRDAAADTARLFDRACRTHALARALSAAGPQPPFTLAGRHRTQYDAIGDLQLTGVGAYPWETSSGFEGLSVLFWNRENKQFFTWSLSRPAGGLGRVGLEHAYRAESLWGSAAPERLSRSQFTLRQGRANPLGRLSGSESTTIADLGPADPGELDFAGRRFTKWTALLDYARLTYPIGLTQKNPLDRVAVLQPAAWGERFFDELQQRLCWPVADVEGNTLTLTLPWAPVHEAAIEFLEALQPLRDRLSGVVCRLAFGGRGILVEPLSILSQGTLQGDRVLNPAFDRERITSRHSALLERLRKKYGRDRVATAMTADDEGDTDSFDSASVESLPPGMRTRLAEVERLLLQVAEAGIGRLGDLTRERLQHLAAALDRLGLREAHRGLAEFERPERAAAALLSNGYLFRLHLEAAALVLATSAGRL
jgi:hypothetical protein